MNLIKSKLLLAIPVAASCLLLATIVWAAPGLDAGNVDGHAAAPWADAESQVTGRDVPGAALTNPYPKKNQITLLAVNPFEIEGTSEIAANGGLDFLHHWLGYTEIWNDTHTQGTIYIPVHNFTTAFGSPVRLEAIDVCYTVTSGSYIYRTGVYYADNTGNRTQVLWDETNRTSTAWTCYNVATPTPQLIQGPLLVYFNLIFGGTGSSHKVTIGQITLTLDTSKASPPSAPAGI